MAYCKNCGTQLNEGQNFCPNCGASNEQHPHICPKCGAALEDGQQFCSQCGSQIGQNNNYQPNAGYNQPQGYNQQSVQVYNQQGIYPRDESTNTLLMVSFIFMCIAGGIMAIPTFGIALAWCIPMTIHGYKIWKGTAPNTVCFGVCTLLFVGLIAGILMLVAPKDNK